MGDPAACTEEAPGPPAKSDFLSGNQQAKLTEQKNKAMKSTDRFCSVLFTCTEFISKLFYTFTISGKSFKVKEICWVLDV